MKWAAIDFEFNQTNEPELNIICCSIKTEEGTKEFWCETDRIPLIEYLCLLKDQGYVFLAYAVTAEARCFLDLGLDPLEFNWIDLYLEYRCLTNHNHKLMYGKQYMNGRVTTTYPPKPKWERTEEDERKAQNSKPSHSLAAAVFKLLGKKIDTNRKDEMRDIIISQDQENINLHKKEIMEYCSDDVRHLQPLFVKMGKNYKELIPSRLFSRQKLAEEMFYRAEYACRTAMMEKLGYPIDVQKTNNFSKQVPNIILKCQMDIIDQFPENPPFYKYKKEEGTYTMCQANIRKRIREWLEENPGKRWMMTDGGVSGKKDLSLSLKAFQKHFNFRHTYPRGHFFAQIIRFLKLKQNLNGFLPGGKNNFWDYVGSDGMVRPYMGIYTAQSSRSQPKATGFIPLKSAWMRCLIAPPKGKAMASIDWASQEYLVSALLSKDKNMIKAYESGDVYLSFLKDAKVVPKDATKKTHGNERNMAKPIILGQQYDLTKYGLATQLSETMGRPVGEEEAQEWIDLHKRSYKDLWKWKARIVRMYSCNARNIKLPDGWYLWGDNPNKRSVGNVPTQGLSACIMRKAVQLAQNKGLQITYTLHDALYLMSDIEVIHKHIVMLASCMDEAFRFYFGEEEKKMAYCRLDGDIWGYGIEEEELLLHYDTEYGEFPLPVKCQPIYIDERGIGEYEQFKPYLEDPKTLDYKNMEF